MDVANDRESTLCIKYSLIGNNNGYNINSIFIYLYLTPFLLVLVI